MITRPRFTGDLPDGAELASVLQEHAQQVGRLARLRAYYDGRHPIEARKRSEGLPNLCMVHGFPRYISTMAAGYLIGSPVRYECDDAPLTTILDAYARTAADSVDAELARDASVYGKGVELLYADSDAQPRTASLDPRSAFTVYDDSVENRAQYGVYILTEQDALGHHSGFIVTVYTDRLIARYRVKELNGKALGEPFDLSPHFFGDVPLIEYWNDEDEKGDFEGVLTLIDAYNLLQSDRMNDKLQFVDALLVLCGCTLETDEYGRSPGRQLREDRALSLPDSDARAEWLCKQLNEADTQVLRDAIRSDIHKLSLVPDLTDEHFAGNSSGVAMRYKLLGLEQLTRIKERWFREALRRRLGCFITFLRAKGMAVPNADDVRMVFTRSLPVNELETAQTLRQLIDILPMDELRRRAMAMEGMH